MSIVVRYTLDLRCDFCPDQRYAKLATFTAQSMTEAHAARRTGGWHVYPAQSLAKCPVCAAAGARRLHKV